MKTRRSSEKSKIEDILFFFRMGFSPKDIAIRMSVDKDEVLNILRNSGLSRYLAGSS